MIQITIIIALALLLLQLVRKGLIQVELSMPWFVALLIFGLLSTNRNFVTWIGVINQNAFWIATILGCLLGSFAICRLRRFRKNSNHINKIKLIS